MYGRVAVIGAGSSGVTAVKNLVEAGFADVVCFERRDVIGGLWHYTEKPATWVDEACVNRATVINTSKEFMSFSDYPMPDHYPNFCHNQQVEEYFIDYCKHFGVEKYIRFNIEVTSLKKHSSYSNTGKWQVSTRDHKTGEDKTEVFDFVLVANGHHGAPNLPAFPGQDKFQGKVMHSKDFKDARSMVGARALVLGIGNSGGDVTVELSKYAKVFLSTRRGAWILNRLADNGLPWDFFLHSRFQFYLRSWVPRSYRNSLRKAELNKKFDHDLYHLRPLHEPDATHPTVNDELPNRIAAGMVVVKPDIKSFTTTGVVFEDGSMEDNIDLAVFATGYKIDYPFMDKSVLTIKDNHVEMYRNMFLPDLPKQTLAFLAVCQPLGSMFPIAEMQSRLAARVFKGEVKLPSPEAMKRDIRTHLEEVHAKYVGTARHTIQVDWLSYMDELAEMVGCKPRLVTLALTDPLLFWRVAFGPGIPYQYRLHGPNTWPGARNAIFTVMDRIRKPFETRQLPRTKYTGSAWGRRLFLASLTAGCVALFALWVQRGKPDLLRELELFFSTV